MKRAHGLMGLVFVGVFLATGVYMRLRFPAAFQGDPVMRMMFRSAHVYILLSALLNLSLGTYLRRRPGERARRLQTIGSLFVLVSPVLFTAAFFVEPAPARVHRPVALAGLVLALLGTVLHSAAGSERKAA